jgi:hypothetical protein
MAVTSIDTLIAGLNQPERFQKTTGTMEAPGVLHSTLYTAGIPGAGAPPAPGINGAALTTYAGQIPFSNPSSGNKYLAGISASASLVGSVLLLDRLWHNSGLVVTTTTAQAITPVAIPARDLDGTTNGEGVYAALEVSTATTNAGAIANTTISYTNQAGTAGRTGTMPSFPASAAAGTFVPFFLQAGDTGVRSVESVTLGTSYVTGAIHLVLYRVLAEIGVPVVALNVNQDAVACGMPRLYNNTVPFIVWLPSATTATTIWANIRYTEG